jgi:hypothetical protein
MKLSENMPMPMMVAELNPGKYDFEYKFIYMGEPDFDSVIVDITLEEIEMWGDTSIKNYLNSYIPQGKVASIRDIKRVG